MLRDMNRARILVLDEDPSTLAHLRTAVASACELETAATSSAEAHITVLPLSSGGLESMAR